MSIAEEQEKQEINEGLLVPDKSLSIRDKAVTPWTMLGLAVMPSVVAELGVRIDVPFSQLIEWEREIILHCAAVNQPVVVTSSIGKTVDVTVRYRNAHRAVEGALLKPQTEASINRLDRFVQLAECAACGGSRLNPQTRAATVNNRSLAETRALSLDEFVKLAADVLVSLPREMFPLSAQLVEELEASSRNRRKLGLGYVTVDRASHTLSTDELQRIKAREWIRFDDDGYRRDHLRALAQRTKVADDEVRIKGSKSELLRTLIAVSSGNRRRSAFIVMF